MSTVELFPITIWAVDPREGEASSAREAARKLDAANMRQRFDINIATTISPSSENRSFFWKTLEHRRSSTNDVDAIQAAAPSLVAYLGQHTGGD